MAGAVRGFFLALAWLCCLPAAGSTPLLTLELRREVMVERPLVLLGDLAVIESDDAALRQVVARIVVGKAPLVGYVEQRSRAYLESLLRGQAPAAGVEIAWRGAQRVAYRAQSQRLDTDAVVEAARQQVLASLGPQYERVEVSLAAALPELTAPCGELEYRARPLEKAQPRQRVAVWVDVVVQGLVYRSIVVPLTLRAYQQVYVAQRDVAAGELAGAAAFALQQQEVGGLAAAPLPPGELHGQGRMRHALARGQVLTAPDFVPEGSVLRGDKVRLVAQGGGIEVAVTAVVQADATQGQQVQVRPERSKETVTATVLSSGVVRIDGR